MAWAEDASRAPEGPPPAREQLPLPRRERQAHLEPQLRTRGGTGTGTPFAAFSDPPAERRADNPRADNHRADNHTGPPAPRNAPPAVQRGPAPERAAGQCSGPAERAAAFHAATRRARVARPPRGPGRSDR